MSNFHADMVVMLLAMLLGVVAHEFGHPIMVLVALSVLVFMVFYIGFKRKHAGYLNSASVDKSAREGTDNAA